MAQITITWEAFGNRPEANRFISSATLELDSSWNQIKNETLLDAIYTATNLKSELEDFGYSAPFVQLWNSIEAVLPANRTHTSLSVGDKIQINRSAVAMELQDGPTYKVAPVGFEMVGA
jgi:hypothetical protein